MKPFFAFFCKFTLFPISGFFTKKIEGRENIPAQNSFILASNHTNGLDHWFIGNLLRKRVEDLRFVGAMDNLKLLLLSGLLYYLSNTIIINRKEGNRKNTLEKMAECLKNNKIVVIYPEGDSNRKKELLRGKTGIAELVFKT
ncbi:MAG: lysophospholipid acyltransferase family protein, partial [Candidatus Paceibacterales bacterium]